MEINNFSFKPAGWMKKNLTHVRCYDGNLPHCAFVFWQVGLPPCHNTLIGTGSHCQPALIRWWFSSMFVRQKLIVRPGSVEQTAVHMSHKSAGSCRTVWYALYLAHVYKPYGIIQNTMKAPLQHPLLRLGTIRFFMYNYIFLISCKDL